MFSYVASSVKIIIVINLTRLQQLFQTPPLLISGRGFCNDGSDLLLPRRRSASRQTSSDQSSRSGRSGDTSPLESMSERERMETFSVTSPAEKNSYSQKYHHIYFRVQWKKQLLFSNITILIVEYTVISGTFCYSFHIIPLNIAMVTESVTKQQ